MLRNGGNLNLNARKSRHSEDDIKDNVKGTCWKKALSG